MALKSSIFFFLSPPITRSFSLPWHNKPSTWISVGCGTARDLEYVFGHVKACGTRLWLLDLSVDLLAVAKLRVEKLGIAEQVTCLVGDICDASLQGLPPPGTVEFPVDRSEPPPRSEAPPAAAACAAAAASYIRPNTPVLRA